MSAVGEYNLNRLRLESKKELKEIDYWKIVDFLESNTRFIRRALDETPYKETLKHEILREKYEEARHLTSCFIQEVRQKFPSKKKAKKKKETN